MRDGAQKRTLMETRGRHSAQEDRAAIARIGEAGDCLQGQAIFATFEKNRRCHQRHLQPCTHLCCPRYLHPCIHRHHRRNTPQGYRRVHSLRICQQSRQPYPSSFFSAKENAGKAILHIRSNFLGIMEVFLSNRRKKNASLNAIITKHGALQSR